MLAIEADSITKGAVPTELTNDGTTWFLNAWHGVKAYHAAVRLIKLSISGRVTAFCDPAVAGACGLRRLSQPLAETAGAEERIIQRNSKI
jgi:hypothetical protein